jgi:hypothetical protein
MRVTEKLFLLQVRAVGMVMLGEKPVGHAVRQVELSRYRLSEHVLQFEEVPEQVAHSEAQSLQLVPSLNVALGQVGRQFVLRRSKGELQLWHEVIDPEQERHPFYLSHSIHTPAMPV